MTVHAHDTHTATGPTPLAAGGGADPTAEAAAGPQAHAGHGLVGATRRWPRWTVPAALGGLVVLGLLAAGILPPAVLLYGGLIAGCGLMHVFMGHGGHGGHAGHGGEARPGGSTGGDRRTR